MRLRGVPILLATKLATQFANGALIPFPRDKPNPTRDLGNSNTRRSIDYLGGYNGTQNSSVVQLAMSPDPEFSFVLTVALALSDGGGTAPSEVLRAASQIVPGDFDSFFNEFYWLGEQIYAQALSARTVVSAREAYFRASSYYRFSNFFITGNASDPRLYGPWDQALDSFHKAISLMDIPGEPFTVSGPGYQIPGYFFRTHKNTGNCSKVPTVIIGSGYDGAQEESWHMLGQEVLDRGWNFVTYEGPGQPTVRRQQKIGFTPEWWNVVTPVVDYLETREDVDMSNLALGGVSFGGLLAPLGASREPRLKAVLSIDGVTDLQKYILTQLKPLADVFKAGNVTQFDEEIEKAYPELPTSGKWGLNQGLWSFNTTSPFDWVNQTAGFVLTPSSIGNITGYGWVGKAENDTGIPGQELDLVALYNSSGQHKPTFHYFPSNVGTGLHCQLGAEAQLAEAALDWVHEIFNL